MNVLVSALLPPPTLAAITGSGALQLIIYLLVLLALVKPLGWLMARVLEGRVGEAPLALGTLLGWLERGVYLLCGVRTDPDRRPVEMSWKSYTLGILVFNALGFLAVYSLQRLQHVLPANPAGLGAPEARSAFNTAVSFTANTNWQGYAGETTMSYLTQMLGLGVQNFLSAATGIAVLAALIRGLARKSSSTIGNCWADLTRITLYILHFVLTHVDGPLGRLINEGLQRASGRPELHVPGLGVTLPRSATRGGGPRRARTGGRPPSPRRPPLQP